MVNYNWNAFFAGYINHWAIYLVGLFILGNRQHALALLGHDGTHYTLSNHRILNDVITSIFTWWPLGITNDGYRNLHNLHHRHVGTDSDPEVVHKKSRSPQWDLPAKPLTVLKYIIKDLFGYSLPDYWIIVTFSKPSNDLPRMMVPVRELVTGLVSMR